MSIMCVHIIFCSFFLSRQALQALYFCPFRIAPAIETSSLVSLVALSGAGTTRRKREHGWSLNNALTSAIYLSKFKHVACRSSSAAPGLCGLGYPHMIISLLLLYTSHLIFVRTVNVAVTKQIDGTPFVLRFSGGFGSCG